MWAHVYFDAASKERDFARLMQKLKVCQTELEVKETPKRGRKEIFKDDEG